MQAIEKIDDANMQAVATIALVAFLGVSPFSFYQAFLGNWLAAFVNTVLVLFLGAVFVLARMRIWVKLLPYVVSAVCTILQPTLMYMTGYYAIFWMYVVTLANFYVLSPRMGVIVNTGLGLVAIPFLLSMSDLLSLSRVMVSFVLLNIVAFMLCYTLRKQKLQLYKLTIMDPLTGVGNRRILLENLSHVLKQYQRDQRPATLIIFDIDWFKKINDIHGHTVGDKILIKISQIVSDRIRAGDRLFRYGGEEFVILLENTPLENARYLAEELRVLVESSKLLPESSVTISMGVSEVDSDDNVEIWLERADAALYKAKNSGRNLVVTA